MRWDYAPCLLAFSSAPSRMITFRITTFSLAFASPNAMGNAILLQIFECLKLEEMFRFMWIFEAFLASTSAHCIRGDSICFSEMLIECLTAALSL